MYFQNFNKECTRTFHLSHSTSPGRKGRELGGVPEGLGRHRSSRQVGGSCPGKGAGLGFPYQPPRKELISKKTLTWGGASKESLQGLRLFWPQAAASLSRPSPPAPLRGAEPSMTHTGQDKGERWDMSHTRHEGAPYDLLWDEAWPGPRGPSDTRERTKPRKESSRAASWPQGSIHLEIFFL